MAIEKRRKADGALTYRVQYRNPITGRKESDGQSTSSLSEAQAWDAGIKRRIKNDPESFRPADWRPDDHGPTFGELALTYLGRRDLAETTKRACVYHLKMFIGHLESIPAAAITADNVRAVERSQRADGVKQNTIHRRVDIIRSVLSWAASERMIEVNPIRDYRTKRGPDERLVPPSPAEVRAIMAAAEPHLARAIRLAYCLGVRVGASELLNLAWCDVDLEARTIRVVCAKKNAGVPWRVIPIRADLMPHLKAWKAEDKPESDDPAERLPWLIHYNRKPVRSIRRAWATALRRAGITRRIRPYDLRHSFATQALAAGADPLATARIMGHSTTAMIHRHYQHVLDHQRKAVVDALPALDAALESPTLGEHPGEHLGVDSPHFVFPVGEKLQ